MLGRVELGSEGLSSSAECEWLSWALSVCDTPCPIVCVHIHTIMYICILPVHELHIRLT